MNNTVERLQSLNKRYDVLKQERTRVETNLEHERNALQALKNEVEKKGLKLTELDLELSKKKDEFTKLIEEVESSLNEIETNIAETEV